MLFRSEANMMGMAAGMAMSGLRPVVYTITPFVTTRCLEQIRVDVCYGNVPVTIVGVGAGLSYASLGATHHSCEDIAFLRALPNMTVIAPADPQEVRGALRMALAIDGPTYIRIGKKGEPNIHAGVPNLAPGGSVVVRKGRDICLLSVGVMIGSALAAADQLEQEGYSVEVVSLYSIKPLDHVLLQRAFAEFRAVVTIEEHGLIGGAGAAIAEWMSEQAGLRARFGRIGTADRFMHGSGHTSYARRYYGLDVPSIVAKAKDLAG